MAITAKELAKKLNLSATAVSMALNNKPGVSTATRDQVIKAAEKYGYDFSRLSLKNGHPGDIYCIIYRAHNAILNYMPIFSELTDGIEQECRNQGYQLKLVQINEKRDDVQKWIEDLLGPALLLVGVFMLVGDRLNLPKFGFNGNGEGLARHGGAGAFLLGMLFAMAFCPTSGVFYFGMLIPMAATATAGWLLPLVFAIATALPVLVVAWILAFSVGQIGSFYGKMQTIQKWLNRIVGGVFTAIGIYYCIIFYF